MAAQDVILNATKALRPLRNQVDNFLVFEEEVKVTLYSLFEKHRAGQSSLKRARMSQLQAAALLEGEIKIWLKMIYRRLIPRMKARNAWMVEFKRAISLEIFTLILQGVKKAHSAYGVFYKEEKHADTISYERENRLNRDFSQLSDLSSKSVREFMTKISKGARKGTLELVVSSERPITIIFVKRTQQVVVKVHYKFTNEFGYTFS